mmetsp:Transcript_27493/g.64154  ORF Transcript_27493/g.64154 Transcript_27493/m.64154 type:complete len:287 (+) Transcript_27493:1455-2315(+)
MSARLVAARTMTPESPANPSISVRIWLSVCSRSSLPPPMPPPPPPARCPPIASISSMNTMHGAFSFACLKRSRTREAPTPTNISTNSDPEAEMNGTPASPATARARSVLPVPGGPSMTAPFGILAPSAEYLDGFFKKSTISVSSCLEPSQPATSAKQTPVFGSIWSCERDLPTPPGPPMPPGMPPPPPPPRARKLSPKRKSRGAKLARSPPNAPSAWRKTGGGGGATTANSDLCWRNCDTISVDAPGNSDTSCVFPAWSNAVAESAFGARFSLATLSESMLERRVE